MLLANRPQDLLAEFEELLAGPEEPCHQFLKTHPDLLCTTHDAAWSKVPFGEHVSDFVFREPRIDYLLVEIEARTETYFARTDTSATNSPTQ